MGWIRKLIERRPRAVRQGWVAPKGGGYSFGAPPTDGDAQRIELRPPRGPAGIGNLRRHERGYTSGGTAVDAPPPPSTAPAPGGAVRMPGPGCRIVPVSATTIATARLSVERDAAAGRVTPEIIRRIAEADSPPREAS